MEKLSADDQKILNNDSTVKNTGTYDEPEIVDLDCFIKMLELNVDEFLNTNKINLLIKRNDQELLNKIGELLMEDKFFSKNLCTDEKKIQNDFLRNIACLDVLRKIERYDLIFFKLNEYETNKYTIRTTIYDVIISHINQNLHSTLEKNSKNTILEYYYQLLILDLIQKCFRDISYLKFFFEYPAIIERDLTSTNFYYYEGNKKEKFIFYDMIFDFVNTDPNAIDNESKNYDIMNDFLSLIFKICEQKSIKIDQQSESQTYTFRFDPRGVDSYTDNYYSLKYLSQIYKEEDYKVYNVIGELIAEDVWNGVPVHGDIESRTFDKEKALILYIKRFNDEKLSKMGYILPELRHIKIYMAKMTLFIGIVQDNNKKASDLFLEETLNSSKDKKKDNEYACVQTVLEWVKKNLLALKKPSWGEYGNGMTREKFGIKRRASLQLFEHFNKSFKEMAGSFAPYTDVYNSPNLRNAEEDFDKIFFYVVEHLLADKERKSALKKYKDLESKSKKEEAKQKKLKLLEL